MDLTCLGFRNWWIILLQRTQRNYFENPKKIIYHKKEGEGRMNLRDILRKHFYKIVGICGIIILLLHQSKFPILFILLGIIIHEFLVNFVNRKKEKKE